MQNQAPLREKTGHFHKTRSLLPNPDSETKSEPPHCYKLLLSYILSELVELRLTN